MTKLSEEEIIRKLKDLSENAIEYDWLSWDEIDCIKELLDLYNKEKEKNKKLDRENQALYESINCEDKTMLERLYREEKEKNKELYSEIDRLQEENKCFKIASQGNFAEEFMKSNYISKDKIKETADDYEGKGYIEIAGAIRELLEERN